MKEFLNILKTYDYNHIIFNPERIEVQKIKGVSIYKRCHNKYVKLSEVKNLMNLSMNTDIFKDIFNIRFDEFFIKNTRPTLMLNHLEIKKLQYHQRVEANSDFKIGIKKLLDILETS